MQENQPPQHPPQPFQPNPANPPLSIPQDFAGIEVPVDVAEDQESQSEQKKLFGAARRREQHEQIVHVLRVVILCVAVGVGLIAFVMRVMHFVLPENNAANAALCMHGWLTDEQLSSMDKFVFGALSTVVAQNVKRALMGENR